MPSKPRLAANETPTGWRGDWRSMAFISIGFGQNSHKTVNHS
jgi:hypothetical protein